MIAVELIIWSMGYGQKSRNSILHVKGSTGFDSYDTFKSFRIRFVQFSSSIFKALNCFASLFWDPNSQNELNILQHLSQRYKVSIYCSHRERNEVG